MRRWFILLLGSLLTVFLVACSNKESVATTNNDGQVIVTTTIAQIADIVKNVGGDHVIVQSLMGPGTDPHLYKATQGDMSKLEDADIIFYNGLHLEGKMNEILEKISKEKPVYAVAENVPEALLLTDPEGSVDPHVWFDPTLWKYAVESVRDGLIEVDPDHEADYKEQADVYITMIEELDQYAKEKVAELSEERRILITAHDAFGYFGHAYGFEVLGLQGLSTDSEYGLKDVQELVDTIVERNIKAIFIETSIADRSINAVVEGAKQKGHEVVIGGELYSDAMGEEGTPEATYEGMFKHNIETIVGSLK